MDRSLSVLLLLAHCLASRGSGDGGLILNTGGDVDTVCSPKGLCVEGLILGGGGTEVEGLLRSRA